MCGPTCICWANLTPFSLKNLITIPGVKGLICAAMLSALMSTVAGALNSIATLVSIDICKRMRPA
jgi:SSS family solute:Na+ symporter